LIDLKNSAKGRTLPDAATIPQKKKLARRA
jgi:hypothetical protein